MFHLVVPQNGLVCLARVFFFFSYAVVPIAFDLSVGFLVVAGRLALHLIVKVDSVLFQALLDAGQLERDPVDNLLRHWNWLYLVWLQFGGRHELWMLWLELFVGELGLDLLRRLMEWPGRLKLVLDRLLEYRLAGCRQWPLGRLLDGLLKALLLVRRLVQLLHGLLE